MIIQKLVVGPIASNCYIVGSEQTKEGIIIDPGAEAEAILDTVRELGLEIKAIVLTHGHMDHFEALGKVKKVTGASVAIHSDDMPFLENQPCCSMANFGTPQQFSVDRLLKDGDSIDCGDLHFLVIHTPGHSPGGICLLGHEVLFSGDTLFNFGIGRYDVTGGNYNQLMDSIHTKLMVLPDDTAVHPGHGPSTNIGIERRGNPFLQG